MTRLYLTIPLILAACTSFKDCPREHTICDPKTGRRTCETPTASLPDAVRERGDRMPVAHEPQKPEPPREPEKPTEPEKPVDPPKEPEKPQHPGKEPPREAGQAAHDAWKDARDRWREAGGQWP